MTHHILRPAHRWRGALLTALLTTGMIGGSAAAATAAPDPTPAAPSAAGHVVLIGGGVEPGDPVSENIIEQIAELGRAAHGAERARVAIVTASSVPAATPAKAADTNNEDNATANGIYYARWFAEHGLDTYPVPIDMTPGEDYPGDPYSADNAHSEAVAAEIRNSDIVYFGGGDQTRYLRALFTCTPAPNEAYTDCADTVVMNAIRTVLDRGGVVAGSSAGLAIQQGADMISGGDPYVSWRDGAVAGSFDGDELGYIPAGGFGFFTEGTLDSHFARRDRQPRVVRLALDTGHERAFGVEENTALVVDRAERTGTVIGALGATMLDVSDAQQVGPNAAGVRYSYFGPGSTIDFATGQIALTGEVRSGTGTAAPPAAPTDIWGSYECEGDIFGTLTLAQELVRSTADRGHGDTCDTPLEAPRFRTTFTRDADTRWTEDGSFTDLLMTISEIPGLSASAAVTLVTGAGSGASFETGSVVDVAVTVTNTGGTELTGVGLAASNSVAARAAAPALAPGASTVLHVQHTVTTGSQTVSATVSGTPGFTGITDLGVDPASAEASVTLTGTPRQTDPGTDPGTGPGTDPGTDPVTKPGGTPSVAPAQPTALAATGASEPFSVLGLGAALLLAGAALTLTLARHRA